MVLPVDSSGPEGSSGAATTVKACLDALDFDKERTSLWGARFMLVAWAVALYFAVSSVRTTVRPLTTRATQSPLGEEEHEGFRYGLPLEKRQAIFNELAAGELVERKRGIDQNTWNGHLWSREDDRGHQELTLARNLAARNKISLTQVYLILDEGIRKRWPAPDGRPLPATTPPQDPRTTW
jgi:hypothetical protein